MYSNTLTLIYRHTSALLCASACCARSLRPLLFLLMRMRVRVRVLDCCVLHWLVLGRRCLAHHCARCLFVLLVQVLQSCFAFS